MCPKAGDKRSDEASHRTQAAKPERPITRQDIQDVLSDPGYSAHDRKGRLKELLTEVTNRRNDPGNRELIDEIKNVLGEQQPGKSLAEDDL